MDNRCDKNIMAVTHNPKMNRINTRVVIPIIVTVLLFTMACTISYEGINFGSDPDIEFIEDQTATAEHVLQPIPEQVVSTPEPAYQPHQSQGSEAQAENVETNEYAVSATNFDCVCQVDGNVTKKLSVKGDQLFIGEGEGAQVYDKIGDNTYKRSWMGYYILTVDGKDTEVEEERSVVIILTDNGYVMEHYQGSSASPCCFHTFTKTD